MLKFNNKHSRRSFSAFAIDWFLPSWFYRHYCIFEHIQIVDLVFLSLTLDSDLSTDFNHIFPSY